MAKQVTIITLGKLQKYDGLLKSFIGDRVSDGVKDSFKSVAIDGYTLKFYTVKTPGKDTLPAFTVDLPETDLSNLITKITGAVAGDVVVAKADGTVADGGVKLADLAKSADVTDEIGQAKTELEGKIKTNSDAIVVLNGEDEGSVKKAVKDASDAINATIGTVEADKTVVDMINDAKVAATYDDTEVKKGIADNKAAIDKLNGTGEGSVAKAVADSKTEIDKEIKVNTDAIAKLNGLATEEGSVAKAVKDASDALDVKIQANADAIQAHKDAVDDKVTTLVGADTGKSVRAIANEELAAQLIPADAKESLDTLQEIAEWIQKHPDDAAAMNKAISALQTLVGTIPEGATATDIVGYIKELVKAEETRATGVEGGLDTRLKTVEGLVGEGGSVDSKIEKAVQDAKDYADGLAPNYATAAQGEKADTALQEADIAELRSDVADTKASLAEGGATSEAIKAAKKAGDDAAAAVTALADGQVATNKTNIATNTSEITGIKERLDTIEATTYVEATDAEIEAMFATE